MNQKIENGIALDGQAIEIMKNAEREFFNNVRGVGTASNFREIDPLKNYNMAEVFEETTNETTKTINGQKIQLVPLEWSSGELFAVRDIDQIEGTWPAKDTLLYEGNVRVYSKNGTCLGVLKTGVPFQVDVDKRNAPEQRAKLAENFDKYVTKDNVLRCVATSFVEEQELMSQVPETLQNAPELLDVGYAVLETLCQKQVNELAKYSYTADIENFEIKNAAQNELTEDEKNFMNYVNERTKDFTNEFERCATANKEEVRETKA